MSRHKVLLYQPRGESRILPLALLHVASTLPEFDLRIIDGRIELTPESTLAELADQAVCLGVTVPTGKPILDALRASRAVKRRYPALPVVWGGWHPSLLPEQCLASAAVDVCVRGPGEETFRELVLTLSAVQDIGVVSGVSYKRNGGVVNNPSRAVRDFNSFPGVNHRLVDLERYFALRGARRLDYCSSRESSLDGRAGAAPAVLPQSWTGLHAERVVVEIAEAAARYRLDEVSFSDEDFFADPGRAEAIARGLIEARFDTQWVGRGRPDRLSRLTPGQWALMRQSGCRQVRVDPGSGAAGGLEAVGGGRYLEGVIASAEQLHSAGIGARFLFVAGSPKEPSRALADTYRTVKTVRKIDARFETPICFYAPYPGAQLPGTARGLAFEAPQRLEDWEKVDLDHSIGSWISEPVRKFVPRYNFYFRYAFEPVDGGLGKRVAHLLARLRVRYDFYRFDFERRLVDLSRRLRTGMPPRPHPLAAED